MLKSFINFDFYFKHVNFSSLTSLARKVVEFPPFTPRCAASMCFTHYASEIHTDDMNLGPSEKKTRKIT